MSMCQLDFSVITAAGQCNRRNASHHAHIRQSSNDDYRDSSRADDRHDGGGDSDDDSDAIETSLSISEATVVTNKYD